MAAKRHQQARLVPYPCSSTVSASKHGESAKRVGYRPWVTAPSTLLLTWLCALLVIISSSFLSWLMF